MYKIVNVHQYAKGLAECAQYIHSKWGSEDNYAYFEDAMRHSDRQEQSVPQFFVLVHDERIVGCFGVIINDFISRHDLYPWLSSVFVEPEYRGQRLSQTMFDHAYRVVKNMGYSRLYLTTDHDGLYEKFGWQRIEDGFEPAGEKTRIYCNEIA
jgi:N-acetylglutamate synthase-like GNAT family acetyltransferase